MGLQISFLINVFISFGYIPQIAGSCGSSGSHPVDHAVALDHISGSRGGSGSYPVDHAIGSGSYPVDQRGSSGSYPVDHVLVLFFLSLRSSTLFPTVALLVYNPTERTGFPLLCNLISIYYLLSF